MRNSMKAIFKTELQMNNHRESALESIHLNIGEK